MTNKKRVLNFLDNCGVSYECIEHKAVYTIEEMNGLNLDPNNEVAKNIFIRDKKKREYFLVIFHKEKRVDLLKLKDRLLCKSRLGFASKEDLYNKLMLISGAVSPLGVINDREVRVQVVVDNDIMELKRIGVHPNDNTATIWLKPNDLIKAIRCNGNDIIFTDI